MARSFDWNRAIRAVMDAGGAEYSSEYGFIETTYHWPLSHMVAPKAEALGCESCHSHADLPGGPPLPGNHHQ
ncbi:MAG: hypothetical protein P8163_18040 [Candidatus Thiodiazotropha sp.]